MRGSGFFIPCDLKSPSQESRGTICICTDRPRTFVNAAAISFGVTRCGPSNSTTRWPLHCSCSKAAASFPISAVGPSGTGLSSGCRKLGIAPCSRAGTTSHRQFSVDPGRRRENRHRQIAERLLDNRVLGQRVNSGLTGLRSDGGKINHSRPDPPFPARSAKQPQSPAPLETPAAGSEGAGRRSKNTVQPLGTLPSGMPKRRS